MVAQGNGSCDPSLEFSYLHSIWWDSGCLGRRKLRLFKPAPEAVLSGWELVKALWDSGIPKEVLQFINCEDEPVGSKLIADLRVNFIVLTGATSTAKLFMRYPQELISLLKPGEKMR